MNIAVQAAEEQSPFLQLMEHLSPHVYSWGHIPKIGGIDFSISNAVLNMWLAAALCIGVFMIAASKTSLVPTGVRNLVEVATDFVKDNIVYSVMNAKDGRTWYPFVGTVFFFILFMNLVGLIPVIGFTPTSNIWVTAALALAVYLLAISIGMVKNGPLTFWRKTLVPDVPVLMIPLMFLIEIISQIARPFSLAVRLFANMLADHVILLIFVGFIFLVGVGGWSLGVIGVIPVAMAFELIFTGFALFVAFIQAVIFAFLTTIYINDALHPGH